MGRLLVRGEHGHDIVEEVYPIEGEPVVDKPGKGAFYATDMDAILKTRGIRKLVVCGVTTEVCVQTSVREANDRGYDALVLVGLRRLVLPGVPAGRPGDDQGPGRDLRLGSATSAAFLAGLGTQFPDAVAAAAAAHGVMPIRLTAAIGMRRDARGPEGPREGGPRT